VIQQHRLKNRVTYRLIAPRFNLILLLETDTCLIYGAAFTSYRVDLKPPRLKDLIQLASLITQTDTESNTNPPNTKLNNLPNPRPEPIPLLLNKSRVAVDTSNKLILIPLIDPSTIPGYTTIGQKAGFSASGSFAQGFNGHLAH